MSMGIGMMPAFSIELIRCFLTVYRFTGDGEILLPETIKRVAWGIGDMSILSVVTTN
jgi:hypothetical protein